MAETIKRYQGRHTGREIDDLLDKVPIIESAINQMAPGAATFSRLFDTATVVWNVVHNLGRCPAVTIVDYYADEEGVHHEIFGDVIYVSENELEVKFAFPTKGTIYLN